MSDIIISAENIGKRYVLNHQSEARGYSKFSDVLVNAAKAPLRWLKTANIEKQTTNNTEDFWALKDVSFEIKQGDVVGIIGRNGAGKSTLLKILSRITEPTTGRITLHGRIASLLEVGTGFHPELTGRENIFLNGAILGMSKAEIKSKFDEIVAFAEIERFLDTPVKRYSSGMYVRLAFAVAAHLEPEILIVDEVLAVGDAQFQTKCLGKMQEVSAGGRTVLFVSHNIAAITTLTKRCLVLGKGHVIADTTTDNAINVYASTARPASEIFYSANPGVLPTVTRIETSASIANGAHVSGDEFNVDVYVHFPEPVSKPCLSIQIVNEQSVPVTHFWSYDTPPKEPFKSGTTRFQFTVPRLALNVGHYTLTLHLAEPPGGELFECLTNACPFTVEVRGRTTLFGWRPNACTYLESFQCNILHAECLLTNAAISDIYPSCVHFLKTDTTNNLTWSEIP